MVKEAQMFMRYVTCMTEFDLAKTDELLDVSYPLLERMEDRRESATDFDSDFEDEELVRLKQWKSHTPSLAAEG